MSTKNEVSCIRDGKDSKRNALVATWIKSHLTLVKVQVWWHWLRVAILERQGVFGRPTLMLVRAPCPLTKQTLPREVRYGNSQKSRSQKLNWNFQFIRILLSESDAAFLDIILNKLASWEKRRLTKFSWSGRRPFF